MQGIVVSAYRGAEGDYLTGSAAVSEPTATDGTYRLLLPPGQYTLVARGNGTTEGRPGVDDYYCYYSGSPVIVTGGSWTPVGFNLVRAKAEGRFEAPGSSIEGVVTYRDEPLERLYLYLYDQPVEGFRGPGIATIPVGEGGRFRVSVRPGKYFVIARKRTRGGMYGPMEIGDHFNYYPGNPVLVEEGQRVSISLETVTRVSQLEVSEARRPAVRGRVVDPGGNPVPGLRVLAYRPGEEKGRPLYFSEPSDDEGHFALVVPVQGDYTLVVRERFGGPAGPDEYSGRYEGLSLDPEAPGPEVTIVVTREDRG